MHGKRCYPLQEGGNPPEPGIGGLHKGCGVSKRQPPVLDCLNLLLIFVISFKIDLIFVDFRGPGGPPGPPDPPKNKIDEHTVDFEISSTLKQGFIRSFKCRLATLT